MKRIVSWISSRSRLQRFSSPQPLSFFNERVINLFFSNHAAKKKRYVLHGKECGLKREVSHVGPILWVAQSFQSFLFRMTSNQSFYATPCIILSFGCTSCFQISRRDRSGKPHSKFIREDKKCILKAFFSCLVRQTVFTTCFFLPWAPSLSASFMLKHVEMKMWMIIESLAHCIHLWSMKPSAFPDYPSYFITDCLFIAHCVQ